MPIAKSYPTPNLLPQKPNLEQLKKQAKELLSGYKAEDVDCAELFDTFNPRTIEPQSAKLSDAQLTLARSFSYLSWPRLAHFVATQDSQEISATCLQLQAAIDDDDLKLIGQIVGDQPDIIHEHVRRSSMRYNNYRPLTYACWRGKAEAARLFIQLGSNIREDGNLPIARGSSHIPILELLTSEGIDVNEQIYDWGPLISHPCESLELDVLQWTLDKGADPQAKATVPGFYDDPDDMFTGTAIDFAARFPGEWQNDWTKVVQLFDSHGIDIRHLEPEKLQ